MPKGSYRNQLPYRLRTPVSALVHLIAACKHTYYTGRPLLSDAEYDALERMLRKLDPTNPQLDVVGDPGPYYVDVGGKEYPDYLTEEFHND